MLTGVPSTVDLAQTVLDPGHRGTVIPDSSLSIYLSCWTSPRPQPAPRRHALLRVVLTFGDLPEGGPSRKNSCMHRACVGAVWAQDTVQLLHIPPRAFRSTAQEKQSESSQLPADVCGLRISSIKRLPIRSNSHRTTDQSFHRELRQRSDRYPRVAIGASEQYWKRKSDDFPSDCIRDRI